MIAEHEVSIPSRRIMSLRTSEGIPQSMPSRHVWAPLRTGELQNTDLDDQYSLGSGSLRKSFDKVALRVQKLNEECI